MKIKKVYGTIPGGTYPDTYDVDEYINAWEKLIRRFEEEFDVKVWSYDPRISFTMIDPKTKEFIGGYQDPIRVDLVERIFKKLDEARKC